MSSALEMHSLRMRMKITSTINANIHRIRMINTDF